MTDERPALVIQITIESDRSRRGFERIMASLGRLDADQRRMLRSLAFNAWPDVLTDDDKDRLLGALIELAAPPDPHTLGVAFDLLAAWSEHGKHAWSPRLHDRAIEMLALTTNPDHCVHDRDWRIVVQLIMPTSPAKAAATIAEAITNVQATGHQRREYARTLFKTLAREHPTMAMDAIGRWIMDEERGPVFCIWEFRGLFDAIGVETVRPWVKERGVTAAVRIARHLDGPRLDDDGSPLVPELADWLLTEFEAEDRVLSEFCMGRHSGVVRWGGARDRQEEVERLVQPFRNHRQQWIERWIDYELQHLEREIKRHDQDEEEMERT